MKHPKAKIRCKRRGLLTTGVLVLHDNARPHKAHAKAAKIKDLHFACLPHPSYSLHLAPSDFRVFRALKELLPGRRFRSVEVQEAVHDWLYKQPKQFFQEGFRLQSSAGTNVMNGMGTMLKNYTVVTATLINTIFLQRF